ncbi:MAG: alpha/beta hydrolase [Bacteroidetes bacterium]|nr:alpha/beta hydrolase [Bacteroidota bacterium]
MPSQKISFKGKPVYFYEIGSGFPVVFLHGFNESVNIWNKTIENISKKFRCILIDLPGFGNSPLPENLSIKYIAESVKRVVDELYIPKPLIIGHSMGAYVALEYLKNFPKALSGIGFIHSTSYPDSEDKKTNRLKTLEFLENNSVDTFFKIFIQGLVAPHNYKKEILDEIEKIILNTRKQSVIDGIKAMLNRNDNFEVYKNSDLPMLILAGKYDQLIPLEKMTKQASETKNAMIEILNNSGHLGMIEEPEKTEKAIIKFAEWVEFSLKNK